MRPAEIAIVGGGPNCTYAVERLAALLPGASLPHGLRIRIFDEGGHFGSGAIHSESQVRTSYMNRVASQIAFAADESNAAVGSLMPRACRPTFAEWCRSKYVATGAKEFDLDATAVPLRYLHGEALREFFERYITALGGLDNVTVNLHAARVSDVAPHEDGGFRLCVDGERPEWFHADHVLFVTGHSTNRVRPDSAAGVLMRHAAEMKPARYVPQAYPLEREITEATVPPGSTVAVLGLGLTAIDVLLHLTEGRGGTFVDDPASLRYIASGNEPACIIAISPSGLMTSCRPHNAKAVDATGEEHVALSHQGVFFTIEAVRELRRRHGTPARLSTHDIRQLDFERHLLPLVVLELAFVYYATLLGAEFARGLQTRVGPRYREFLCQGDAIHPSPIDYLLEPVQAWFDQAAEYVAAAENGGTPGSSFDASIADELLRTFRMTVYGDERGGTVSPWLHSPRIADHRFDWRRLFEPVDRAAATDGALWQEGVLAYMRRDHLAAAQGNLRNPTKAASDGVWRDLRSVFSEAADFGGLTARSQQRFLSVYLRVYSRMSNGASLEAMRKVLSLIESGFVDLSIGPDPTVEPIPGRPAFLVTGSRTGHTREVTVVIEGRAHPFDPEWDAGPLYPNLLRRGLIRCWRNPDRDGEDLVPGALDLSRDFHPLQPDGTVQRRLTFLGSPAEGLAFFQLSAARPQSNSAVLNNVARWARELMLSLATARA